MSHKVKAFTMLPRKAMKHVRLNEDNSVSWLDRNGVEFKVIKNIKPRNVRSWWVYLNKTFKEIYF